MDKRKQGAIDAHGVPLVQLDYYTGEYVDEYPCVQAFCDDYNIPRATVHRSFSKSAKIIATTKPMVAVFMLWVEYKIAGKTIAPSTAYGT